MISIADEDLLTLTEATKVLPRRRNGKKPSVSTLWRWAKAGLRGHRLESLMVGGVRCTTCRALQEFFERVTEAEACPESRRLIPQRVDRDLDQDGF
jgi:hypothetical protein